MLQPAASEVQKRDQLFKAIKAMADKHLIEEQGNERPATDALYILANASSNSPEMPAVVHLLLRKAIIRDATRNGTVHDGLVRIMNRLQDYLGTYWDLTLEKGRWVVDERARDMTQWLRSEWAGREAERQPAAAETPADA